MSIPENGPAEGTVWGRVRSLIEGGDLDGASALLEDAAGGTDWWQAANAARWLAELCQSRGMASDARRWYEAAIASGEPDIAPTAACGLAAMMLDAGEQEEAKAALSRAMAFRGSDAAHGAALLGQLELADGNRDAARTCALAA